MKHKLLIILFATLGFACSQENMYVVNHAESDYYIDFVETYYSPAADSIYHRFNIINSKTNEKELLGEIKPAEIETVTSDKELTVGGIRMMDVKKGTVPENIVVSLLIDRSVHTEDMYNIQHAVKYIVDNLPRNSVYISFFDDQLQESRKITSDNFDSFETDFTVTKNSKIIFDAALKKFQELCGMSETISDAGFEEKIKDDDVKKYLLLLTDGRVDANDLRTADNIQQFSELVQELDEDDDNRKRIIIHALRYGEKNDDVDFTLSYLCVDIRNTNVRGGSYFADPVAFIENLKVTDNTIPDYELTLVNHKGKIYQGKKHNTALTISKKNKTITGQTYYVIGTLITPVKSGTKNSLMQLIFGIILGVILMIISYLCMQIIVPYIRFKSENFNNRYVRRYTFEQDTIIKCHYCLNEIRDGEEIVTKCHHTVHKHCWIENGCKCTDYGRNCKTGKQYLFDTTRPFGVNNRPYFTKFAMYGMGGALLSWIIFRLIYLFDDAPFSALIGKLLPLFANPTEPLLSAFYPKTGALLLISLLLGFILVLIFSFLNKFRQRKKDTLPIILLRSIAGALFAFISALTGVVVCMISNAYPTNILVDWIPWLLLGSILGIVLLFRTNTVWKQIIPGGILSGLVCFVILLTGAWLGLYAVIAALLFFGAGIGISFISSRHVIHKYFLRYKGHKEEKIAIHKWMSVAGGSNDVSIGKSIHSTIQMNWDTNPSIKDIHVKLYFDKKNRLPCMKILANDVTYNGVFAKINDELLLKNGARFTIGNTEFEYIEN